MGYSAFWKQLLVKLHPSVLGHIPAPLNVHSCYCVLKGQCHACVTERFGPFLGPKDPSVSFQSCRSGRWDQAHRVQYIRPFCDIVIWRENDNFRHFDGLLSTRAPTRRHWIDCWSARTEKEASPMSFAWKKGRKAQSNVFRGLQGKN